MNKNLAIIALLMLSGCISSSAIALYDSNGFSEIGVKCRSHIACLKEASAQCPGGYDQVEKESKGNMIIKCHGKSQAERDLEAIELFRRKAE